MRRKIVEHNLYADAINRESIEKARRSFAASRRAKGAVRKITYTTTDDQKDDRAVAASANDSSFR